MAGGPIRLPIVSKFDSKGVNQAEGSLKKFGGVAAKIGAASVAAIAGIGAAALKMSSEFESSFAKIQGLVGVSADQLGELEDAARTLGPQFGKSAQEAADALFFITSAGLRGEEAITVLEASLKGAAAGLGDTKTIADLATSAVNAYGSNVLDGAKAVDVLTEAVREGKLEPAELAGAMGQVLPISSALGVQFDEVGAAMAAMSRTGTDASSAATQLRQIMATLAKPTVEAEEALGNMGLSAEGLRQQVKDEGLLSVLETLTDAFDGNIEATSSVFGNIRALSGVLDLMGPNVEGTRQIFANMTDDVGALDDAFSAMEETVGFKFNRAIETAKSQLLPVGDILLDIASSVLTGLGPTIEMLGPLLEDLFVELEPVISELLGMLPGLLESLSPILPVIGDIAEIFLELVAAVLPPIIELLDVIMPLFEEFSGVVATLITDALDLLAPVLMDIAEMLAPIIEAAFPVFMKLVETLTPLLLELIEMFLPLLDYILPVLEALLVDLVIPALDIMASVLSVTLPLAMELFKNTLGRGIVGLGDFSEDFQMLVYGIRKWWAESFNDMIVHVENFLNAAIRGLNWFIEKANSLPGVEINFRATEISLGRLDMPDLPRFVREMQSEIGSAVNSGTIEGIMKASGAAFAMGIEATDFRGTGSLEDISFLSNIPQLAEGAIVKSRPGGILANVGEGNYDEAVIPLRGQSMGNTYNVTVNAGMGTDGSRVGEAVVKAIKAYERSSGPVFARA